MLVEKVESGRGEGGPEEIMVLRVVEAAVGVAVEATDEAMGLRAGTRSGTWVGRLRLRMAFAAETGSLGTREVGSGGMGEGGGECW